MIVFPVKIFPWIFIIVGIGLLIIGEMIVWAIILLLIGLLWAGYQVSGYVNRKNARQAASSSRAPYNTPQQQPQPAPPYAQPQQPQQAKCPNCGNTDTEGMIFCGKCGYKLK